MAEDPAAVLRGSGWIEGISATEESKPLRSETQTDKPKGLKPEKWWNTAIQVGIPFFIAGVGTIAAGIILGHVEQWDVFRSIPELFVLVPALLGLKGNLDMTMASRLSTQANLGNMSKMNEVIRMVIGNVALVQVQATVAAFIVSMFALSVGTIMDGTFMLSHAFLVTASSMFTATTSCFFLDFILSGVIVLATKAGLNPDNLATPLAAALGDVVSISLLSLMTSFLYNNIYTHLWIAYIIISFYFLILPFWIFVVWRNHYVRPVLRSGWVPVLSALFISGMGGLLLMRAVVKFAGFVVFQPIINGIGGNLVAVQASKISTMLYQSSVPGILPAFGKIFEMPWRVLFYGTPYSMNSLVLILISIPGQVIFIFVADFLHQSTITIGAPFVFSYMTASLLQIFLLFYIGHVMIHAMWRFKIDPDSAAIPFLTALADLFGSMLLLGAFAFLRAVGREYQGRPIPEVDDGEWWNYQAHHFYSY